jgi:hypothetical protein
MFKIQLLFTRIKVYATSMRGNASTTKSNMRKLAFVFMILVFLTGCVQKDYSPYSYSSESTIYSESSTTPFREFVIIIDPYLLIGYVKKYIVCDTLKNVNIRISDKPWNILNSFAIDTSLFIKEKTFNLYLTNTIIKYSIIASYKTSADTLTTAGEYSDLLNNYLTLEPGNYICQIESFDIKQIDGSYKRIKPFIVVPVEIKENSRSSFVGEFDVQINNN